jgi:hypothetical protein
MNRRVLIVIVVLAVLVLAGTIIHAWPSSSHPERSAPVTHHHVASTPSVVSICHELAVAAGTDPADVAKIRQLASPSLAASLIADASHDPAASAPAPTITVVADGPTTALEHLPGGVVLTCTVKAGRVVSLS